MYICVILRQGQKILVPCERSITSDTLKWFRMVVAIYKTGKLILFKKSQKKIPEKG